jgi:uncharacterized UBP type Zn finger protein
VLLCSRVRLGEVQLELEGKHITMEDRELALATILSMGYAQGRAEKALFLTGNKGAQAAIDWYVK